MSTPDQGGKRELAALRKDLARVERWLDAFVQAWDNTSPHTKPTEAPVALMEAILAYLHKHRADPSWVTHGKNLDAALAKLPDA